MSIVVLHAIITECGGMLQAQNGSTALHNAAAGGHAKAVEALVAAPSCDSDVQNSNGNTALHLAASKGEPRGDSCVHEVPIHLQTLGTLLSLDTPSMTNYRPRYQKLQLISTEWYFGVHLLGSEHAWCVCVVYMPFSAGILHTAPCLSGYVKLLFYCSL